MLTLAVLDAGLPDATAMVVDMAVEVDRTTPLEEAVVLEIPAVRADVVSVIDKLLEVPGLVFETLIAAPCTLAWAVGICLYSVVDSWAKLEDR